MKSPRPKLCTEAVLLATIDALLAKEDVHGRLGCEADDEDELQDALRSLSPWLLDDPARLARDYADDAGLDVDVPVFELADEITSIASDVHRDVVAEWVASGDAERTIVDTLRVAVRSGGESLVGCGFVEASLDRYGQFAFVPDEKLPGWIHPEGGFNSYRIVNWEDVVASNPPTDADLALVDGQRRRREAEAASAAESRLRTDARLTVEKRCKACVVDLPEAEALWSELGLGDDADRALLIHKAILVKLTALEAATLRKT